MPVWRKSSFSGQGNDCVELRGDLSALRDSKNPDGSILTANPTAVSGLVRLARSGVEW